MAQVAASTARTPILRWVLLALLLGAGLALFLWHSPDLDPVARPAGMERLP